jgi:hypothetical protein
MQITKREWIRIISVNLGLLCVVYAIAITLTHFGIKTFEIKSVDVPSVIEEWHLMPTISILFSTIEASIIGWFASRKIPKWYFTIGYVLFSIMINVTLTSVGIVVPGWIDLTLTIPYLFIVSYQRRPYWKVVVDIAISIAISFLFNEAIGYFRTEIIGLYHYYDLSVFLPLSIEYDLALFMALKLAELIIGKEKEEDKVCRIGLDALGSSPNLSPKIQKSIKLLKVRVAVEQTAALICIALVPIFFGKGIEFSLVFVSFTLTRLILGFKKSIHFASEAKCIGIASLCFILISCLVPSVKINIIFSFCYGAGFALALRLYWELRNLRIYKDNAKTDYYAEFAVLFKNDVSRLHVSAYMKLKGFDDFDTETVCEFLEKTKIEAIALKQHCSVGKINLTIARVAYELKMY